MKRYLLSHAHLYQGADGDLWMKLVIEDLKTNAYIWAFQPYRSDSRLIADDGEIFHGLSSDNLENLMNL